MPSKIILNSCTGDNKILYHGAAKETRGEAAKGSHILMKLYIYIYIYIYIHTWFYLYENENSI